MRAKTVLFAAALAVVALRASAGNPRITFDRTIVPVHDLAPAEQIAVIYAIGDHSAVNDFVEDFVGYANRAGALRIENAIEGYRRTSDAAAFRKRHHADLYLGVHQFTCDAKERTAEGSEHDPDGGRVKVTHQWVDVVCGARIDVLRARDGKKTLTFTVRGEGTSPRAVSLTEDERTVAYRQASHQAAVAAAESITPRTERESIELDAGAPSFDEGYSLIAGDRLSDARAIWETALRKHHDSAALMFDLAAVSEAMGDVAAAGRYFERAEKLRPAEARYRSELNLFRKRRSPQP